jgi:thiamine pyrophosphate-dependent acetolactate synthase large subunit-like protein
MAAEQPGARGAGAELQKVAEILGAPVVKASLGKDCLPDDNPYVTGGIGVIGTGTNCSTAAALPYAIGAQTAFPGRQVIAFTGDGKHDAG